MEPFTGSLSSYRLQMVMPPLFTAAKLEGTLRVERGAIRRQFFVKDGFLVGESSTDPREHLAQVLVHLRILDAPRAAAAFEAAESADMPYGTFLVQRCFVELPRLLEAMEHKAREALFDCYDWESGEVEFTPGLPLSARAIGLRLPLATLHRDAVSRLREWAVFREIFPHLDVTFRVFREFAVETFSEEEDVLLDLAAGGATLGELLASAREAPLFAARWVLHLYRRGALAPQRPKGPRVGESAEFAELLGLVRAFLSSGKYDHAVALAAQILERGPVPEAHALYREAEIRLTLALSDELFALDGRLVFEPIPRPTPSELTADDLYLYSKLRGSRSIRQALRTAAMGELAASRSVHRLMACGLIHVAPLSGDASRSAPRRTTTEPYGIPLAKSGT
ncbi:DUF4388 domain-containing protein [Corallococcus sp. H22C18031201]|uniref:DUF4388 domain-containing protein n=1 Tax=Citreicoccus inhibens TaxID=2849499 RepID=UPI000E7183EB|nr:DUF4388 domain-containing protein [Citreicoccus inhibens]MBU8894686.1 DUF4388 domain-containing protein [Citreicoccus inhibens]RJS25263.1 DUF4388 domain-containing protein [Corallococcus sp. H22C18031201]